MEKGTGKNRTPRCNYILLIYFFDYLSLFVGVDDVTSRRCALVTNQTWPLPSLSSPLSAFSALSSIFIIQSGKA
jgi:hypothetical protein